MAGEWKRTSLREAGVTLIDCDHRTPPAADSGYPYVAIPQLKEGRIVLNDARRISPEHFAEWTRKAKPQHHDVILSRRCNPGDTAYVPAGLECALGQNLVLLRADGKKVFPPFLRWLVRGPDWWEQVGTFINVGALFDSLKCADIPNFRMPLPPLADQKSIAAVLAALDDKIELNRRMNATLEAMARALFQSWFIDFDPVRANMDRNQLSTRPVGHPSPTGRRDGDEGRFALDPATTALFPDSIHDSPVGHIPAGWEVAELGQTADIIDCLHAKKPERCENGQLYLQLNNIRDDGLIDITDSFFVSAEDYQKWISRMEARAGDCVVTNVGRVGAVGQIPEGVKAALGRNITGIRCKSAFPFPTFLIECLVSESMREEIRLKTDSGTILDALNVKSIPKLRFVRPTREIGARFESLTRPLRRRMEQNLSESHTLATVRDTLLPKLLSGELSVVEAESS